MRHSSNIQKNQKPLLRVMRGEKLWPPPIWLMRQAGRFLPEFRAIREKADFLTRCTTPELVTELTLQPIKRFKMDGAILFSDILILPWSLGQDLQFIPGKGPQLNPCRHESDLSLLNSDKQEKIFNPIEKGIKEISNLLRDSSTSFLGFAGSPFTVACYMIEGGSSKDFAHVKEAAYKNPQFLEKLIQLLTNQTISWLSRQIEAGVEGVMLFDSWASLLSPSLFRKYVVEPTKQISSAIKQKYPHINVIGFPRLCGTLLKIYGEEAGVDVVSCDTTVDLNVAGKLLPSHLAIQGNLDPFAVVYGGEIMEEETVHICQKLRSRPHIFNLGHGVLPQTPVENVGRLIEIIRKL